MQITINSPLDMHIHFREGYMLKKVAPLSAKTFAGGLIMPNTNPPIVDKNSLYDYIEEITETLEDYNFRPYMSLFFNKDLNWNLLERISNKILSIKLYPAGITTNSEEGINYENIDDFDYIFESMADLGIPLCIHGETGGFVMDRENEFIAIYKKLAEKYPKLKIIMEHVTTKDCIELVDNYENIYATITAHHLYMTLDDVAGGLLQSHLFCKPIAKRPEDRQSLRDYAFSGHPKIMFGSDSAPHPRHKKESLGCAAGVFTSPIALQLLAQIFEENGSIENLFKFVSHNAKNIYNIEPPEKKLTLKKEKFKIPESYGNIIPFKFGETLDWSIERFK